MQYVTLTLFDSVDMRNTPAEKMLIAVCVENAMRQLIELCLMVPGIALVVPKNKNINYQESQWSPAIDLDNNHHHQTNDWI